MASDRPLIKGVHLLLINICFAQTQKHYLAVVHRMFYPTSVPLYRSYAPKVFNN